jgi:hypothetical protein
MLENGKNQLGLELPEKLGAMVTSRQHKLGLVRQKPGNFSLDKSILL